MRNLALWTGLAAAIPGIANAQQRRPSVVIPPAPPVATLEEKYGDWYVYRSGNTLFASTTNGSGSAFGVICNSSCAFFFNPKIPCTDGGKFPVLINSPAGAFSATLTCKIWENRNLLSAPFDTMLLDAMEIGGELGVALPMESGQFRVTRFSLTGALKATTRAYSLSPYGREDPSEKGLRDQTL